MRNKKSNLPKFEEKKTFKPAIIPNSKQFNKKHKVFNNCIKYSMQSTQSRETTMHTNMPVRLKGNEGIRGPDNFPFA